MDRVKEVITIQGEDIAEPPKFNQDFKGKYLKGIAKIGDKIIMLLESSLLLTSQEIEMTKELII